MGRRHQKLIGAGEVQQEFSIVLTARAIGGQPTESTERLRFGGCCASGTTSSTARSLRGLN